MIGTKTKIMKKEVIGYNLFITFKDKSTKTFYNLQKENIIEDDIYLNIIKEGCHYKFKVDEISSYYTEEVLNNEPTNLIQYFEEISFVKEVIFARDTTLSDKQVFIITVDIYKKNNNKPESEDFDESIKKLKDSYTVKLIIEQF